MSGRPSLRYDSAAPLHPPPNAAFPVTAVNALLLFLAVAGHTKIVVEAINRLHARRLRESVLKGTRHVHDVLILLFPLVLLWWPGLSGPRLLLGGSWTDLPTFGWVLLGVCWLGAAGLAVSSVLWWTRSAPSVQTAYESNVVDVETRLGRKPLADGPYRWLANVPGNQAFQFDVVERTFRLPGLPAALDGLSILHLSDLHYIGTLERAFFDEVMAASRELEADVAVVTGDVVDDNRLLDWIPATLGTLSAPLGRYFILGNHDWRYDQPGPIRDAMTDVGWTDVAGRAVPLSHAGETIGVGGDERPWMGDAPNFDDVPNATFRLLLSHTPDNLGWARRQRVDLMLSGHNHGGQVVLPVFGPVYSPSRFGCRYAAGAFDRPPTTLVVSRGLSGQHPLRLNCRPEIAKLVLRSAAIEEEHAATAAVASHAAPSMMEP